MESDIAGRNLTDTERSQVDALRKQLTSLIHKPWEEASVAKSIVATAKALPETAVDNTKHAAYGAYGIGKGILHGAVDIFDMTKLLVGVAVDAKQRAEVSRQCRLIGECLQQEGFASIAWEQAKELVAKEWERIQKLPSEQQSEAIGKMAGTVIFSLAAIK